MDDCQDAQRDQIEEVRSKVLEMVVPNVAFDGWTDRALAEAVRDAGVDPALSRLAFPRGGVDAAASWHKAKDAELAARIEAEDMLGMRYSDKVARALELRLEVMAGDREAVRRAASLFALPIHGAEATRLIWHTADTIWIGLGDTSEDVNWYTKRATLGAVWSSVVLYWLGDESPGFTATRDFITRRIDNVMQIEKVKAGFRKTPAGKMFAAGPGRLLERIQRPGPAPDDLPGRWRK